MSSKHRWRTVGEKGAGIDIKLHAYVRRRSPFAHAAHSYSSSITASLSTFWLPTGRVTNVISSFFIGRRGTWHGGDGGNRSRYRIYSDRDPGVETGKRQN
ncbi:hypothetical protein Ancab_026740 [Ancistrocladus abbreviatus]